MQNPIEKPIEVETKARQVVSGKKGPTIIPFAIPPIPYRKAYR
jgi:hypothetical protein